MDWLAAILVILSSYLTGRKNKWGWIVGIISSGMFMYIAFNKEIYGMIMLDIFLIIMNAINFKRWLKEERI